MNRTTAFSILLGGGLVFGGFAAWLVSPNVPIPPHTIEKQRIVDGERIWVYVKKDITAAQCRALIDKYRNDAGEGQVSVKKPCGPKPKPYCYENFDGHGIQFANSWAYDAGNGQVKFCWKS